MSGVFRRFLTATAVSDTANGVFAVAATMTAATTTHSAAAVAAVTVAATLPWLIAAVPAGVLVDRMNPVRAVTLANLGRCVAMLGLAALIWADVALTVTVPALVFVVSCFQTVVDTAAEVVTANAVDDARRTRANGLLAVSTRLFYQFLGPALAGVLVDVDPVLPGVLSGLACLAAALVAAQLPRTAARVASEETSTGFWDGARIVFSRPILATIVAVGGLTTIANSIFFTVLVVYAITPGPLGLSTSQYGFLVGAIGVGAACGALATHHVERLVGRSTTLTLTRVGWALVFAGPLFAEGVLLTAVMAVGSALGGMWSVESMSVRQLTVDRGDLGRVSGASRMLTYGMTPVGAAIGGAVALAVDATVLFAVSTVLTLLTVVPIRVYLSDRAIEAATRPSEPGPEKEPVSETKGENAQ
ncbi:MFS transporter [Streptomyces lincolnensis]|uniref:MFS transporter n=1 Tax=Streptomyces lincolnensis TaxID=1915 RepID=UPI001E2E6BE9|nr:MFS transporter [Streptomyces lincolnensis]MCD7444876.1 MFS transporter [Streptomyces lincolnensis]